MRRIMVKIMVSRSLTLLALMSLGAFALAEEVWMGIYLGQAKIGYASTVVKDDPGGETRTTTSQTIMRSKMLGGELNLSIRTVSQTTLDGQPKKLNYIMESAGRSQTVLATFAKDVIDVIVVNNGQRSEHQIKVPAGARVVDDATTAVAMDGVAGTKATVHVLDPTTVTLIKTDILVKGDAKTKLNGKDVTAKLIEIQDPRSLTKIYLSSKGDLLKIEGPLGMIMLPEPKEKAEKLSDEGQVDLAHATALKTDKPIPRPQETTSLTVRFSGKADLVIPNGPGQDVRPDGDFLVVKIAPPGAAPSELNKLRTSALTIEEAKKSQTVWTKPGLYVPSDDAKFVDLAKKELLGETNSLRAAERLNKYVFSIMRGNAGIGVLRNAHEVLETKEGVCRDSAILAATLMRAAGIPTQLISGLIYDDGQFYYHAWVEVWTGNAWVPLDPTRADRPFEATHITLARGTVEEALTFRVVPAQVIQVVDYKHGS